MKEPLQIFIESLREELKQYGELLALLDLEQDLTMRRQTSELLPAVAAINAQAETLRAVRCEREQRRLQLARALGLAESIALEALVPHLPPDYRPLVRALLQENKHLLIRVQQRARQNHLLLSRVVELMQRFIHSVIPGSGLATYTDDGAVALPSLPQHSLFNQLG